MVLIPTAVGTVALAFIISLIRRYRQQETLSKGLCLPSKPQILAISINTIVIRWILKPLDAHYDDAWLASYDLLIQHRRGRRNRQGD
jgi:hypothetical protein